jgi:dTDP-4-amino-4,6-dideoxygalactose transaminase
MIYISKTNLPPLSKYVKYLKRIWKSNWLTNNGEFVQELEKKLEKRLKVKNVVCVSSGTAATMIAIKALGITKKIYVSPYSYISTVSTPVWMGIKPVFVDFGEKWKGPALVTHIYGLPNLVDVSPVIYDASHSFANNYKGKSILSCGDVSIISFHAVKIFQTVEGGALVTNNNEIAEKARWMRNFGFKTKYDFYGAGINCKMSEFHAAMGLCVLPTVDKVKKRYKEIIDKYNKAFGYHHEDVTYYPVWFDTEKDVLEVIKVLERNGIYPRRYFYPPLNKVFNGKKCPTAEDLMSRVLCLPLYYQLKDKEVEQIINLVESALY